MIRAERIREGDGPDAASTLTPANVKSPLTDRYERPAAR